MNWAKIENNKVVDVLVLDESKNKTGAKWLSDRLGGTWIKANNQKCGIGYEYISETKSFRTPAPFDSWTWNEDSESWESPEPYPNDGKIYDWDEESTSWVETPPVSE